MDLERSDEMLGLDVMTTEEFGFISTLDVKLPRDPVLDERG